jgi:diamine N-acetyltransferase
MKLSFRSCDQNDLMELLSISRSTYYNSFIADNTAENMQLYLDSAFSRNTLTEELEKNESEFYFVSLMDVVVGYFKINWGDAQKDMKGKDAIEIERIYVLKEFQRKKLGRQMLEKIIEIAKHKSVKYIWLGVWEKNIKAIRFYDRNSFEKFGTHDFMLGNERQTDLLMKLYI